jgi:hypothetical protein
MNLYLLIFSFIQYPLSFATNIKCDLSKVIKGILVANSLVTKIKLQRLVKNKCFSSSDIDKVVFCRPIMSLLMLPCVVVIID